MKITIILITFVFLIFLILPVIAQPSFINAEFNGNFSNGTILFSDIYVINGTIRGADVYPDKSSISKTIICINTTIFYLKYLCTNKTIYKIKNNVSISIIVKNCSWQNTSKIVTNCNKISTPISCLNPNGSYTNKLSLSNFRYSLDNLTWSSIPYFEIPIDNLTVYFKVDIPLKCSPRYFIDKAIFIR